MNNSIDGHFAELRKSSSTDFNISTLNSTLHNLILLLQSSEHRNLLNESHWKEIANLAVLGSRILSSNDYASKELEFVSHVLRFLRNACGGSAENQNFVLNIPEVFEFAKRPLRYLLYNESAEEITVLKICIQLFGNILLCNETAKPVVWELFFKENTFKALFNSKDQTVVEYTMMVLYNCMSEENSKYMFRSKEGHDIIVAVTNKLLHNSADWGMLFMEYLIRKIEFLYCCYDHLPLENRLLILDIIIEHLNCAEQEENAFIPTASIEYIKKHFLNHVAGITQLGNSGDCPVEPSEFVRMLSLLCSASVCTPYIPYMQSSNDLLEKSIDTLKCIHLLGKNSDNCFSSVCSTKPSATLFSEEMSCHPLYGFKKDLIRIIGNLCYGCKDNQDLVRSLDGIPLILDCCKLDAKNPYIMQWCILAIRNIMEHNQENQAILAGITTTGEVVDSSLLKEMGIQICVTKNTIN